MRFPLIRQIRLRYRELREAVAKNPHNWSINCLRSIIISDDLPNRADFHVPRELRNIRSRKTLTVVYP